MGLSIIIPAFNESAAIVTVIEEIVDANYDFVEEIVVVDDGSSDNTAELVSHMADPTIKLIKHPHNRGYGAAIKTGAKHAVADYIMTMDADGQHRVEDIARLWEQAPRCDMVVGKREKVFHSPIWRMPGKWLLTLLAAYLVGKEIPDLNSGLRLFRREVFLRYQHLYPSGFSLSTTTTMTFFNRGYRVRYVPIEVKKRKGSSMVSLSTGFNTLILIIRISALFGPLRIFLPIGLALGGAGLTWGAYFLYLGRGVTTGALLALFTALMFFALGIICDQISQLRLERFE